MPGGAGKLASAYAEVSFRNKSFLRGLSKTQKQFDRKTSKMRRTAKRTGKAIKQSWKVAAAGTAILAAAVGKTVEMYTDFEDAQVELQKKLGATEKAVGEITDELTMLSTQMPTTRQELTETAAAAAKVGVAKENIVAFTEVMLKFQEATSMASEAAALAFGRITAITQEPVQNVEKLGSAIAYAVDNFPVAEAQSITQVMLKMGRSLSGGMDVSAKSLVGLATAVSSTAQRAERPATQLMRAFTQMGTKQKEYAENLLNSSVFDSDRAIIKRRLSNIETREEFSDAIEWVQTELEDRKDAKKQEKEENKDERI